MKRPGIVLIGFMGAGKTTIGRCLARALGAEFLDTDELIEEDTGKKIAEIFALEGEESFREMETRLLKKLGKRKQPFVLSAGGGMPVRKENRELLRSLGTVVYLEASKETIVKRVSGDCTRPLLQGEDLEKKVTDLMSLRERIYRETAHRIVQTDEKTQEELASVLADCGREV